ncbi:MULTISPECIES: sel1 repeat family protein [unclassified Stenotrophomonas]|uniref:sel1 repeat family protein n=1 Tax=unclassified Stenotrophomonas TaxID=196198 RepID=UPI0011B1EE84|nr:MULTISPECIES: sel1 repeat family protein [unclassified Stenotrophomonas]
MKKKLIGIGVAVVAMSIVIGVVWGYRLQTNDAQRKLDKNEVQENAPVQNGSSASLRETTAHKLETEKKIPPGSYKPLGPKAYEIIRGREFRAPGDALAHVKQLIRRSEAGDATATYEIYLTIEQCQAFTSDRADELAQSATSLGSGGWFLERSERLLKECESLALDQDIYHADWLSKAAAMGSQEAMLAYAVSPQEVLGSLDDVIHDPERLAQWKENSSRYLNEMANQGNIAALGSLRRAYSYGRTRDRDPVAALAYTRVLNRINPQLYDNNDIVKAESDLTSRQRSEALALSEEIFKNCCISR